MASTRNIFQSIQNKNRKLKICLLHFDQQYETALSKTNQEFYILENEQNMWNKEINNMPENFYTFRNGSLLEVLSFDLIITGGRFTNNPNIANQIRSRLMIPCYFYENQYPWNFDNKLKRLEDIPKRYINTLRQTSGSLNIFASKEILECWDEITNNNIVIPSSQENEDEFLSGWNEVFNNHKELQ